VAAVDPGKLVFVDESGINTSMTRARGRGLPGVRVEGAVPCGNWKTMTMLGAVRLEGVAALATVQAPTDTDVFHAFVRGALVPALREGDVVVWDGLGPHKAERVKREVEAAKAELMPLPPYSPDLSPIEPCWSKVKVHVRDAEPRTPDAMGRAAAEGFAGVTESDCRGWFAKCGYGVH
jgi:transposase